MTDFAQAFQNDHNNISDAMERYQSAASQVILSHNTVTLLFWCAWRNLLSNYISISHYSHEPFFAQVKNHLKRV